MVEGRYSTSSVLTIFFIFFFFNDTPPTEIYTLPLHDPLPISKPAHAAGGARDESVANIRAGPRGRGRAGRRRRRWRSSPATGRQVSRREVCCKPASGGRPATSEAPTTETPVHAHIRSRLFTSK